jgi:hypothetical protein
MSAQQHAAGEGRGPVLGRTRLETTLGVRLSRAERDALTLEAARRGMSASELARAILREAAGYGPQFEGEERAAVAALASQVRSVGVNLNQAARAMNGGRVPPNEDLAAMLDELSGAYVAMTGWLSSICARRRRARIEVGEAYLG